MPEQPIIVRKKVVKGGHAHHGGSWKVAYADFVTAMMAFFLVMWLINLSPETKDQIQGYFNDPMGLAATEPKSRSLMTLEGMTAPKPGQTKKPGSDAFNKERTQLDSIQQQLQHALNVDKTFQDLIKGIRITQTPDGLLIEFVETKGAVFFESGSAVIRPEAAKLIAKIAPILSKAGHPLEIQGHTDAQPFAGAANGNWGLSTERALSLQEALLKGGVGEPQFSEVSGFAARRLLDAKHPTGFSNRRVTILLPRKYLPGNKVQQPADALRESIKSGSEPEAVVVKPDPTDIVTK